MKKIIPYLLVINSSIGLVQASQIPELVFDASLGKEGFIYDFDNESKTLVKTTLKAPSRDRLYIRPLNYEVIRGGVRGNIECFKDQTLLIRGNVQLIYKNDPANYLDFLDSKTKFDVGMKITDSGDVKFTKKIMAKTEENEEIAVNYEEFLYTPSNKQIRVSCDFVHFNPNSILFSNSNLKMFVASELSGNVEIRSSRGFKDEVKNEKIVAALKGMDAPTDTTCLSSTNGANGPDGKNGDDADILSSASSGSGGGHGAHGGAGCKGKNGEMGLDGIAGSSITLQVTNFDKTNSLVIESIGSAGGNGGNGSNGTVGGNGGHGGRGGSGGDGHSGGLHHGRGAGRGGNGGNGGAGGDGGNGGRGGYGGQSGEINVMVLLPDNEVNISSDEFFNTPRFQNINAVLNSMLLLSAGGRPGAGGMFGSGAKGGKAGHGGAGGDGGSGGILVSGGSSGQSGLGGNAGADGNDGKNGAWGQPGLAGSVSYSGHKLISVKSEDIERARPQININDLLK